MSQQQLYLGECNLYWLCMKIFFYIKFSNWKQMVQPPGYILSLACIYAKVSLQRYSNSSQSTVTELNLENISTLINFHVFFEIFFPLDFKHLIFHLLWLVLILYLHLHLYATVVPEFVICHIMCIAFFFLIINCPEVNASTVFWKPQLHGSSKS